MIAKIPNADRARFAALLQGSRDDEKRDRTAEDFQEIIFEGMEGMPAARDHTRGRRVGCERLSALLGIRPSANGITRVDLELEALFGLKHGRSHGFFPASAYRGPFLPLLRHHPCRDLP